ncbi:hypothetical protein IFR05_010523 [Cadophora sp. M221]|nr:hypothetical protein IFR05_010523 [Cadophora sp. M221]
MASKPNDTTSSTKPSESSSTDGNNNDKPATVPSDPADKSNSRWLKDAGWRSMYDFMLSYELKICVDEDYEKGKAILKAFRDREQEDYEEAMKAMRK